MRQIWKTAKIMLALLLFLTAVREQGKAREHWDIVTVFLEGDGAEVSQVREICSREAKQEEAAALCFWEEQEQATVSCQSTGQSAGVSLLTVLGNGDLAVPGTASLAWRQKGCFLDRATAEELFGTAKADGQMLWRGQESYTVRGTFDSMKRIMAVSGEEGQTKAFRAVSLRFSDNRNGRAKAEQFLMRHGLSGEIIDFVFLNAFVQNLLLLFPAAVAVRLTGLLLRGYGKAGLLLAVIAAAMTIFLICRCVEIPADMIPTQWSDFSFWSGWWTGQKQNILRILETPLGEAQLSMLFQMGRSVFCSVAAVLLIL